MCQNSCPYTNKNVQFMLGRMGSGDSIDLEKLAEDILSKKGISSSLENLLKGFCPPCKLNGRNYIYIAKNMEGIMSSFTKTIRGRSDYVREGFCLTLVI